jgi:hypothetical protein
MPIRTLAWHKGLFNGTVFILGNGPSVVDHKDNFEAMSHFFPSISMNRGYELFEGDFYVSLMNTFYMDKVKESNYDYVFMVGGYTEIPESTRHGFKPDLTCIPRRAKHDPNQADSFDLTLGWKPSHTGILALYVAVWLGFDTAVLVGYDGYGRHFMPRVLADDVPNHTRHIAEMKGFMKLDHGLKIYNCNQANTYGQEYMSFEAAVKDL